MYASLLGGRGSHKEVPPSSFWLLRLYYQKRLVMGYCCVSAEVLYLAVYLLHWPAWAAPGLPLPYATFAHLPASFNLALHGAGLLRPGSGAVLVSWVGLLALAAVPGWALKQVANCAQLKASMDGCVAYDLGAKADHPKRRSA